MSCSNDCDVMRELIEEMLEILSSDLVVVTDFNR